MKNDGTPAARATKPNEATTALATKPAGTTPAPAIKLAEATTVPAATGCATAATPSIGLTTSALHVRAAGRHLVTGLDASFLPGELWCVAGPNGAGKTTLLTVLAGLRKPDGGSVALEDRRLDDWSMAALARRRSFTGQVQHDAFGATVFETVLLARHPYLSGWGWESAQDHAAARAALDTLELTALARRDVRTLSGGERQRVAIAAALCQDAALMLLDEPLAHLDLPHQVRCLRLLARRAAQTRSCILFSCHDLDLARRHATHALLLDGLGDVQTGLAKAVLSPGPVSRAFGYPLILLREGGREALVPGDLPEEDG